MLLAFYMLTLAFQDIRLTRTIPLLVLMLFFQHMSLWSYESQLFIMLVAPLALLLISRKPSPRFLVVAGLWYLMPSIYIFQAASHYLRSAGQSYQQSVMRHNFSVASLFSDWIFNISASLRFWKWDQIPLVAGNQGMLQLSQEQIAGLAVLAVGVFIGGGVIAFQLQKREHGQNRDLLPGNRILWISLGIGLTLLVLSFPAYLLLNSARSLWRTQFLSGIGTGIVMGSMISLAAGYFSQTWLRANISVQRVRKSSKGWLSHNVDTLLRLIICLVIGACIVFAGAFSAIRRGAFHYAIWEKHRQAILQVLQVAPQVKPGTIVVLTNVPKDNDPFRHNMWFEVALRLAYPETSMTGIYFYEDGSPSAGNNLKLQWDSWQWDETGWPPLVRKTDVGSTLVIRYDEQGIGRLEDSFPVFLNANGQALELYDPKTTIESNLPDLRAARRYTWGFTKPVASLPARDEDRGPHRQAHRDQARPAPPRAVGAGRARPSSPVPAGY